MLRIRLSRVGKKKRPSYRLVVADSRASRDGPAIDIIGHYDPLPDPAKVVVNEERAIDWLKKGAQPSEAAAKLLTRLGIMAKAGLEPFVHAPARAGQAAAKAKTGAKAKGKAKAKAKAAPVAEPAQAEPVEPEPEPAQAEPVEAQAEPTEAETQEPAKAQEPTPQVTE